MSTNSTAPATTDPSPSPKPNPNPNPISKPSMHLQDPEELQRVFKRFDANGDGKISINELDNVLRTLGSGVPPEELQRVMDNLDIDHDGFIDFTEFSQFCLSYTEDGGASELRDAFNLYDHDKNGLISASELHMVLNRLGLKCTVEECCVMIKSVDSDGDGNVCFEEFKTMMTNKPMNGSVQ